MITRKKLAVAILSTLVSGVAVAADITISGSIEYTAPIKGEKTMGDDTSVEVTAYEDIDGLFVEAYIPLLDVNASRLSLSKDGYGKLDLGYVDSAPEHHSRAIDWGFDLTQSRYQDVYPHNVAYTLPTIIDGVDVYTSYRTSSEINDYDSSRSVGVSYTKDQYSIELARENSGNETIKTGLVSYDIGDANISFLRKDIDGDSMDTISAHYSITEDTIVGIQRLNNEYNVFGVQHRIGGGLRIFAETDTEERSKIGVNFLF